MPGCFFMTDSIATHNHFNELAELIGGVDIYLVDQILKGRFAPGSSVLDAGCGNGRNLRWFLRNGHPACAVDEVEYAIDSTREAAHRLAPDLPADNFRLEPVEEMTFGDGAFDSVLSIAVLHFARDLEHFRSMLFEMWRVLANGGTLFVRVGSTTGIESLVVPLGKGRYRVPDGSIRFLVNTEMLIGLTQELNAELLEPIKTVNVQNQRCMTTWGVAEAEAHVMYDDLVQREAK